MRLVHPLVALLLAGCVAPPPGEDAAPPAPAPASFTTGHCVVQEIMFAATPESVAPFLPEGFEAEPFPGEGMVALIALVMQCAEPEVSSNAMIVIPLKTVPADARREGADAHAVVTSVILGQGAQLKANLEAWGYGPILSAGTTTLQDVAPAQAEPAARAGRAEAASDAGARFSIGTTVRGVPRTDEGNFIRFFMVHDRLVLGAWDCDLTGNHRVHSGEARMQASSYAPLPDAPVAGLGFHEFSDLVTWTRAPAPGTATSTR